MVNKKLTVADLIALKGKRKIVLTTAFDEWTAKAAEEAGVDLVLAWGADVESSKFVIGNVRRGAPNTLIGSGINPGAYASAEEALGGSSSISGGTIHVSISQKAWPLSVWCRGQGGTCG